MSIFSNKQHFLHSRVTYMESIGILGNDHFINLLSNYKLGTSGSYYKTDHSTIDWDKTPNHHQFFFDYEGNNKEIEKWLCESELKDYEYLLTWLSWEDPIIKIKTSEFIREWEWFYIASVEGMIIITEDGKKILEFTDDYKYHLNSNFEIRPNSKK